MRLSVNMICPLKKDTAFVNALVPNILRRGCTDYPTFQLLNRKLDDLYGAVLYADVRKNGDWQVLSLSVQTISDAYTMDGERSEIPCAELLISLLLDPCTEQGCFRTEDFQIEKKGLVEQILSEDNNKRSYAVRRTVQEMFKDDPHGISILGETEDGENITEESAFKAYLSILRTARIEVICTGNCSVEPLKTLFEEKFSRLNRDPVIFAKEKKLTPASSVSRLEQQQQVLQSKLVMGFSAQEEDVDAAKVAVALYGGTVTSKLFSNVREKMSLCYYCAARWDERKKYMIVDSGVANENVEKAENEILRQLHLMASGDVSKEECEETLSYLRNSLLTVYDSLSAMEQWVLTRILLGDLTEPMDLYNKLKTVDADRVIKAASGFKLHTIFVLKGVDPDETDSDMQ